MTGDYDVIIVGSGPAGISAAFPLVRSGIRVLMVDGGKESALQLPEGDFLSARRHDVHQYRWMIGDDFYALQERAAVSPKLRVPTLRYVFDGFGQANRINADDFVAIGSLATGGLSNAWGCGVAALDEHELGCFPFSAGDLRPSYEAIAQRIGLSGQVDDDLTSYFGVDQWSKPPVEMDALHKKLLRGYLEHRKSIVSSGLKMGRSRVAVLSEEHNERRACERLGTCLWGCRNKSLYSARDDVLALSKHSNFKLVQGLTVQEIKKDRSTWQVNGLNDEGGAESYRSNRVMLAAGTLASTRLVLKALRSERLVKLQSCPTAAFMLWLPSHFGNSQASAFGLGQLSYAMELEEGLRAFGSTFSTAGIPVTEFVRHLPLTRRNGIDLMRAMLSSCLVGNVFLQGILSSAQVKLDANDTLSIVGGFDDRVPHLMKDIERRLRKAYWKMGAILLPGSFRVGSAGSDIHYAGTLPMRSQPGAGETDPYGEVNGLSGVFVVDGASLTELTEKSHTFTIMANADRIGRAVAAKSI